MKIEIVAELAQGFEGSIIKSELLIAAAQAAGADAVKFQMVYADELATPDYKYYNLFKELEFTKEEWGRLSQYAQSKGIALVVDIFGEKSLEIAIYAGVSAVKIHGTDITNLGLLEKVANSTISKVMLGAGGATKTEILTALTVLRAKEVVVIFGFQSYPTLTENNQLSRISHFISQVQSENQVVTIGFADHSDPSTNQAIILCASAIGAGASLIEKHLTLARGLKMEDFESALNPDEFQYFVQSMQVATAAMGVTDILRDDFGMSMQENEYAISIRRHVVANQHIKKGERIDPTMIGLKRTSCQTPVSDLKEVYGKIIHRGIEPNMPILQNDI